MVLFDIKKNKNFIRYTKNNKLLNCILTKEVENIIKDLNTKELKIMINMMKTNKEDMRELLNYSNKKTSNK